MVVAALNVGIHNRLTSNFVPAQPHPPTRIHPGYAPVEDEVGALELREVLVLRAADELL